jgi:hypothetical protein
VSAFEFFFGFYSLILGLSVVEVLNGFARTLRARRKLRLGYCTPLLALFVLLDLIQFWSDTWNRDQGIPVNAGVLTVALAIAAVYYLAASLIFPDRLEEWESLDDYYDGHKRQVILASLTANLLSVFALPLIARQHDQVSEVLSPSFLIFMVCWTAPMAAICFVKDRRINGVLLGLLCAVYLAVTFAEAIFGG